MFSLMLSITLLIADSNAHAGRTDKYGCHRDNSTGTRHCHNDSSSSSSSSTVSESETEPCYLWEARGKAEAKEAGPHWGDAIGGFVTSFVLLGWPGGLIAGAISYLRPVHLKPSQLQGLSRENALCYEDGYTAETKNKRLLSSGLGSALPVFFWFGVTSTIASTSQTTN